MLKFCLRFPVSDYFYEKTTASVHDNAEAAELYTRLVLFRILLLNMPRPILNRIPPARQPIT